MGPEVAELRKILWEALHKSASIPTFTEGEFFALMPMMQNLSDDLRHKTKLGT